MKKSRVLIAIVIVFLIFLGIWSLVLEPFPRVFVETARVPSPDGKVEAVVIESDVGAPSAAMHQIYIVPVGKKPDKRDSEVLHSTWLNGLRVMWSSDGVLDIGYGERKADRILKAVRNTNVAGQTYGVVVTPHPVFGN